MKRFIKRLATPLSLIFGTVTSLRAEVYARVPRAEIPLPVIAVGNLVHSGTGKTPVTLALTRALFSNHKLPVAIITRGYGRREPFLSRLTPTMLQRGPSKPPFVALANLGGGWMAAVRTKPPLRTYRRRPALGWRVQITPERSTTSTAKVVMTDLAIVAELAA